MEDRFKTKVDETVILPKAGLKPEKVVELEVKNLEENRIVLPPNISETGKKRLAKLLRKAIAAVQASEKK